MEQNPSTEANCFSASQDNPPIHNRVPLVFFLTQINTEHSIKSSCLKMHLDITLSSKWYLTFIFSHQNLWAPLSSPTKMPQWIIPYPTAFPYGNGMVLHFYQQQGSSTTKTVHKVINKGLKTYV